MKVRATKKGQKPDFTWAQPGEEFEVPAKQFSETWMEKVTAKKSAAKSDPVPADEGEDG